MRPFKAERSVFYGVTDLGTFVLGTIFIVLVPGPNSLYVMTIASRFGIAAGYRGAAGIFVGDLILMTLAATGVASVFQANPALFVALKYAGAAYLVWLGLRLIRQQSAPREASAAPAAQPGTRGLRALFMQGFLTNVLNPKVILFFISFFPQFVDRHAGHQALAFLALGSVMVLMSTLWNGLVAEAVEVSAEEFNPSDYAVHLTRRARGVPFWFSLATHGVDAYRRAVDTCLDTARAFTAAVEASAHLELFAPTTLSIVTFTRPGWERADYQRWSDHHLATGQFFIAVSEFRGQPMLRICLVNPLTTMAQLQDVIDSLV